MIQIIQQTHEEKVEMYNKLSKKQLIMMLIESNNVLDRICLTPIIAAQPMPEIHVLKNPMTEIYPTPYTTCSTINNII